jgi:hypothetical protein
MVECGGAHSLHRSASCCEGVHHDLRLRGHSHSLMSLMHVLIPSAMYGPCEVCTSVMPMIREIPGTTPVCFLSEGPGSARKAENGAFQLNQV